MRRHRQGLILFFSALLLLAGCVSGVSFPRVDAVLRPDAKNPPTPADFAYCYNHGCKTQQRVSLTPGQWAEITAPLATPPADAAAERAAVALVVGRFEATVGPLTRTDGDRAGTDIFPANGQLDCVDEAVDTTRLLTMLSNDGLLRFHSVSWPVHRGFVAGSLTHMTAVLREKPGGSNWAVDSWFHDSGQAAEIVPLIIWLAGWHPEAE